MNLASRSKLSKVTIACVFCLSSIFANPSAAYSQEKPIFYMFAKPGCYAAYSKPNQTIPLYSIKKIYPVSCFSPHHFEVFWAGQFTAKEEKVGAGRLQVVTSCMQKSKEFVFYGRNANFYNYSADEQQLIGNWNADTGVESQRFPYRSVCYASVSTKSWLFIKEINFPIIKGFEKYDN
jgi:hypothetical protein